MRQKTVWIAAAFALAVPALACEQRDETSRVEQETADLQEARSKTGEVVPKLEQDLEKAKAEVVRLEEELALAKQGLTQDVRRERGELQEALKAQQSEVKTEITEAQREAKEHNEDAQRAEGQLEATKRKGRVESEVKTETKVVPGTEQEKKVETVPEKETIEVERVKGSETEQPEHERQSGSGPDSGTP